jgi:hypothetical protein
MNKYYVYQHIRLDTGECFYIGKGTARRFASKKSRNAYWHNIVNLVGYKSEILASNLSELEAFNFEKLMITLAKDLGQCVANITNGGEGASGYKHSEETKEKMKRVCSEETKNKIRQGRLGKYSGENHPRFGVEVSQETRNKIRIAHLGGLNNSRTRKIKFKELIYVGVQKLADFENVHYKTIAYRLRNNPINWGYEVLN